MHTGLQERVQKVIKQRRNKERHERYFFRICCYLQEVWTAEK